MQLSPLFPDRADARELLRPWKLSSFALAMAWLFYGALNYGIADWDVGITVLMGGLTYFFAPWSLRTILAAFSDWKRDSLLKIGAALFAAWFVVDGVYVLYHTLMGNRMFRADNFYVSSCLYFLAGCVWLYRGSVRELIRNVRDVALGPRGEP
jgi:hypothetical protein